MARDLFAPTDGLDVSEPVVGADLFSGGKSKGPGARGFGAGVAGIKAAGQGLKGLGARIVGAPAAEAEALAASQQTLEATAPDTLRVEDVTSPGEAVDFVKYAFSTALPSILMMAGGGLVGRAAGALLGKRFAAEATRAALKNAGMVGGAGGVSVGLEAGSIFPAAVEEGVADPAARAVAGGVAAGALDILPGYYLARRLGVVGDAALKAPRKAGFGAVAKGAGAEALKTAGIEAGTEGLQTVIERIAAGQDLQSPEAISDIINSAVIGGVAGAGFGAGAGAVSTARRPIAQPELPQTPPAAPAAPVEVPAPLPTPLDPAALDQRASDIALLSSLGELPALPSTQSGVVPTQSGYNRLAAPIAEDADLNTLAVLRAQQQDVIQKRTTLAEELQLPDGQRRTKSEILREARVFDGEITALTADIGQVEQMVKNRVALQETPTEPKPKGKVTPEGDVVPRESGAFKQPQIEEDTSAAELAVAQAKRGKGQLVSTREAKLLRDEDATRPPATPLEIKTEREPRSRDKQTTPEHRAEVIEGVTTQSIETHKQGLVFRQGTEPAAIESLKRVAQAASKASTIEVAEKAVHDAAIRALARKVNKQDAETFAQAVAADVRSAPTFYSKGATERTEKWQVINVDTQAVIAGPFATKQEAEKARGPAATFPQDRVVKISPAESRAALAPTKLSDLLAYVPQAARTHAAVGGSSTNLVTGQDLGGSDNYTVSIYKDRELKLPGQPTEAQIRAYVERNADLLASPDHMLGTWYNEKDGYTYIDVSLLSPNVGEALRLGREHQQLAVFYLGTYDEIPVGNAEVFDLSQEYNSRAGLQPAVSVDYIPADPAKMRAIALAYEKLPADNSADPRVTTAYAAFVREVEAQFAFASERVKIEPWRQQGQPYANSAAMMADVKNNHLWVFEGGEPHPLMTPEQNWKFRAIHDIFGHAKTGFEFGPRGELNATRAHAQMFSQAAVPALVTETLGQNAWVNFGPANEGKAPAERAYAVQKADLLPAGLWRDLLDVSSQAESVDRHDHIFSDKGQRLLTELKSMLGEDPNLEVRLYQAEPGEAIGGYTRTNTLKSVISMALNTDVSVAYHEGFHYLEDRVLDGRERIIIGRQLKPGTELFNQLLTKIRAYDLEHKTQLADEILSSPQEARAYGYEFWKRGELQVDGTLAQIFQKIRQFIERLVNYIDGLGFTSIEDIFQAIDRGQYSQRGEASRVVEADTDWTADVEPDVFPGLVSHNRKDGVASKAKGRSHWV